MPVYLNDIPLEEAHQRFSKALQSAGLNKLLGAETIPLNIEARGRVLAETIWAKISSPHQHNAAMDGYAVRSSETHGASQVSPVVLQIPRQAQYIDTGDPIPDHYDAVIPIENVEELNAKGLIDQNQSETLASIRIRSATTPWHHVRPLGEDLVASQLVLAAGRTLKAVDLGAIAASGHTDLVVARKPRVAILPTGSELIPIGEKLRSGSIIEHNSLVLAAQVTQWGAIATQFPIIKDDINQLVKQVSLASNDHDLILINAGSSAGSEDYTSLVIDKLGEVLVHGIAVRPGHPVVLGMINRKKGAKVPVIGVPGYPVSAVLTNEFFVEALLSRMLGRQPHTPITVEAQLTQKVTSPPGDDDFVRVAVGKVGKQLMAAPLKRGAGVLSSLVNADGLALFPRGIQGHAAGEKVSVQLYSSPSVLEKTIFMIGSHDLTIDILAQYLAMHGRKLSTANVGSIGGLLALQRGVAHMAGSHLLDPDTMEYNIASIKEYVKDTPLKVIGLVERDQGLIVRKGNPKGIKSIGDLSRTDIQFINRQRGAGTKILLEYHLKKQGIDSSQIQGYDQEEFTHLNLAAAIASGRADCGLGIHAAASALELDFVPLFKERFDLIIPTEFYESELLKPLMHVLKSETYRAAIDDLIGYSSKPLGKLIYEIS